MESPKKISQTAKRISKNGSEANLRNLGSAKKFSIKSWDSPRSHDINVINGLSLGSKGEQIYDNWSSYR